MAETESFNWFEPSEEDLKVVAPAPRYDISRHHHLATNILDSYSRATDLLAEVLQNATDAVDTRSEHDEASPREIEIEFDTQLRRFRVTDTGTGLPKSELKLALAPNVSFKAGGLARPRRLRARGEKGVGLSFIALACDELSIRSCDGKQTIDATILGANQWVRGPENKTPPPCDVTTSGPSKMLGSSQWTSISVSKIDVQHFGTDLFEFAIPELVWRLRTETAIGNTAHLFSSLGRDVPEEIIVALRYTSARGTGGKRRRIPYSFLSPEEFMDPRDIVDYEDVKELDPFTRRRRLRGKALRYVAREERSGGRVVELYALVVDGREMRRILAERRSERKQVPPKDEKWQGVSLAVRDMPAGVGLEPGILGTTAWEQRLFAVLQYDDLALDLGRKTMAARTRSMLNKVVTDAWASEWGRAARQVQPSPRLTPDSGQAALRRRIESAQALPALEAAIPYLKEPVSLEATQAIFHELIATADSPLNFTPLSAHVFASEDALIYRASPNGEAPLHVIFGVKATDVVEELEKDDRYALTADLAVVWEVDTEGLEELGLEVKRMPRRNKPAATHELKLSGIGDKEKLKMLALRDVLALAEG